jgi:adenylate cyclase
VADDAPTPSELEAMVRHLRGLGATDEEVSAAIAAGRAGGLSLELTLRPDGPTLPFDEAAASWDLTHEEAARIWQALGFADPGDGSSLRLAADEVQALGFLSRTMEALLGSEGTLALARIVGSATSRLAEAVVDKFRTEFEHPRRQGGTPYHEVVEEYSEVARTTMPPFLELLGTALRRHLVAVSMGEWLFDETPTTQRHLVVGFCDLVGYTELSGRSTPTELAALVGRFEQVVGEVVAAHRGRVVKLIGDAAMFVCDDAADGAGIGLDLVAATERDADLPPARVALAEGTVVSLHGDHYGTVVNLAARLLATADPGAVVVADAMRPGLDGSPGVALLPLPPQALKGFADPQVAHLAVRSGA